MPDAMRVKKAKARRLAQKEEKMKAKLDAWIAAPLRTLITNSEQINSEFTQQLQTKVTSLTDECRKLQHRINMLESTQETRITDQVSTALNSYLDKECIRSRLVTVEREVAQQDLELKRVLEMSRQELLKLSEDAKTFQEITVRRLDRLEDSPEIQHTAESLQKLTQEFVSYVSGENEREVLTRRLEYLVKDMEARNWPWRPNMDRSQSPPRGRDFGKTEWRPWPANGPVRPQSAATSALFLSDSGSRLTASPPMSRPSSARRRVTDPDMDTKAVVAAKPPALVRPSSAGAVRSPPVVQVPGTAAAGGGHAAARMRTPRSAAHSGRTSRN
eukprot:TRINITY_DN56595_c0_g1_i1.p1 TRINITY_DN56595_c0_g1~~TRINITY_DN56595_c0_g1_i1.p1  ORF type:complete len:350 (-),score=41.99 TRINITY_DN56595_c0_g1_i1:230-1219(-)